MNPTDADEESGSEASFTRWQGRLIAQLGFVNNLLLVLATGLVAFETQLAFARDRHLVPGVRPVLVASMVLLGASLVAGVWAALSRLTSFRFTTSAARLRELAGRVARPDRGSSSGLRRNLDHARRLVRLPSTTQDDQDKLAAEAGVVRDVLRSRSSTLDRRTWRLITVQLWTLMIGAATFGATSVLQYYRRG